MRSKTLAIAGLVTALVAALAAYAYAQSSPRFDMGSMHQQSMQGTPVQGMHGGMGGHRPMVMAGAADMPTQPGQAAFGAIAEIVAMLQADPSTDWSKVNIAALREHLIDMNEVTMRADAVQTNLDHGVDIKVTGTGRTLVAIKRMVPAHMAELKTQGWNARTEELPDGVRMIVTGTDAKDIIEIKALGFMGIMVQGGHHQPHHFAMAKGESIH